VTTYKSKLLEATNSSLDRCNIIFSLVILHLHHTEIFIIFTSTL